MSNAQSDTIAEATTKTHVARVLTNSAARRACRPPWSRWRPRWSGRNTAAARALAVPSVARSLSSSGRRVQELVLTFVADLHDRDVREPGLPVATASTTASRSGPRGIWSATSSGRTNWLAASKFQGVGRSRLHFPAAREPAELLVRPDHRGLLVGVPADRDLADRARRRQRVAARVVPRAGPHRARLDGDQVVDEVCEPLDRVRPRDGGAELDRVVGQVRRSWPSPPGRSRRCSSRGPCSRAPMISTASSSMSWRSPTAGQRSPTTCSLVPTPTLIGPRTGPQASACCGTTAQVVPQDRARHVGRELDPLGRLRDRAQERPRVRRMSLRVEPGEVVVAGHLEVEPEALGGDGVATRSLGPDSSGVAESSHGPTVACEPRRRIR